VPLIDKPDEISETVSPYIFHGLDFRQYPNSKDATTTCPFCDRPGKFSVLLKTGQWRCVACNEGEDNGKAFRGGNAMVFIRKLYEYCLNDSENYTKALVSLAEKRGFLDADVLQLWGVTRSIISGEWLVPAYSTDSILRNLYRYVNINGKMRLLSGPKPSFHHQIFGMNLWDKSKPRVIICEGVWDAIALYEVMKQTKMTDEGILTVTGSELHSLLNDTNIIALPGCNVFHESWCSLLSGKDVIFMFDNDHPRNHPKTGQIIQPAALSGIATICSVISSSGRPPASISYLKWGEKGYSEALPDGMDLRDVFVAAGEALASRINAFSELADQIHPAEPEWLKGGASGSKTYGSGTGVTVCEPCSRFKDLINAWRRAMKWTEGLEDALTTMLASIISTKVAGDQLWVKIIGPASCGKTTLCEAISTNRQYVFPKDTMTGLFSGYVSVKNSGENMSMAELLDDKTLVIKDADTILQNPAIGQILSQFRAFYDRSVRTQYKNEMSKDYENISTTVILCGTSSLRMIDSSELGERFLDCVIMEGVPDELEDEILNRVARRVASTMTMEMGSGGGSQTQSPTLTTAMQLTGGYIEHLRTNAFDLIGQIDLPDDVLFRITRFAKFTAFMRARPSEKQKEIAEREFASRLTSQLIRYAVCTAAVMNKKKIDKEVFKRTRKRALDTSRGQTLEIARLLYAADEDGLVLSSITTLIGDSMHNVKNLLRFLRKIGVIEVFDRKKARGIKGVPAYRLTPRMRILWEQVYEFQG
jgi:hypothetical protein